MKPNEIENLSKHIIAMIKDLEDTRDIYNGYSYVRTMRNILCGKESAIVAPCFKGKSYYGCLPEMSLEMVEIIMDTLVQSKQLEVVFTNHGKLYCTKDYHDYLCGV